MTKLYRLLTRAQMHGEVREPGYVFTLAEGERGPHRTMVATKTTGMMWRHFTWPAEATYDPDLHDQMRDEPLYEPVPT